MTDTRKNQEQVQADLAPETHNDEQDDHLSQAQEVTEEARNKDSEASPLDSTKVNSGIEDNSEQDLVDRMRDMEQSGRIDMGAYRGEPNLSASPAMITDQLTQRMFGGCSLAIACLDSRLNVSRARLSAVWTTVMPSRMNSVAIARASHGGSNSPKTT